MADIEAKQAQQTVVAEPRGAVHSAPLAASEPEVKIVYVDREVPAPTPEPPPPSTALAVNGSEPKSAGQLIGQAYDALEALRLADALPIEQRAPLAALIAVLQTKNGSQLGGTP